MTSKDGETVFIPKRLDGTLKEVDKEFAAINSHRADLVLSKYGIAMNSSAYPVFDLANRAVNAESLQDLYENTTSNPNCGDSSLYLNCKKDITELPDSWKSYLSTTLKTFNQVNENIKTQPQVKTSPVANFVDSI